MTASTEDDALRTGRGIVVDEPWDVLAIGGRDAVSLLQTKLTCDTRRWADTGYGYGFATDINGKVVFDGHFVVTPDAVLLMLAAGGAEVARGHLDRYVIMEDVTFSTPASARAVVRAVGIEARAALETAAGEPLPAQRQGYALASGLIAWSNDLGGGESTWLMGPSAQVSDVVAAATAAGAVLVSGAAWERERVLRGEPRTGVDVVPGETIPLEAGAWHGVSFNKGCYLGQEVIERLHSRGAPNKRLCRLEGSGPPPPGGAELRADGRQAGSITSAVATDTGWRGLGWVRRKPLDADEPLALADDERTVVRLDVVGGMAPA